MKKVSAMILLVLTNTMLMFVMYVITAMSLLAVVGVPLALALFAGHVWAGFWRCRNALRSGGWLNKPAFLICACAPAIALTALMSVRMFFADDGLRTERRRTIYHYLRGGIYGGAWNGNVGEIFALTQK